METLKFKNLPSAVTLLQKDQEELKALLLQKVQPQLQEIEEPINVGSTETLTGLTKPTLYRYVQQNKIPYHKNGNRLYFFKSEIINWIKEQKTLKEMDAEVEAYLQNNEKDSVLNLIIEKVEKGTGLTFSEFKKEYTEENLFNVSLKYVTTTKKALCKALDINIDNACRYKRKLEKRGLLVQSTNKIYCPFTKRFLSHLISTNPDEFQELTKSKFLQKTLF